MGPKKIKRSLYAGQGIPTNASKTHVHEVLAELTKNLLTKMNTEYKWLAACTVAVNGGMWGGDRRVKARKKLLTLINECRSHLEMKVWELDDGWERHNLFYGYWAISAYSNRTGMSTEQIIFGNFFTAKGG